MNENADVFQGEQKSRSAVIFVPLRAAPLFQSAWCPHEVRIALRLRAPDGLIALTRNAIQRLFTKLIIEPTRRLTDTLPWSRWRRRALASHYRHQQAQLT